MSGKYAYIGGRMVREFETRCARDRALAREARRPFDCGSSLNDSNWDKMQVYLEGIGLTPETLPRLERREEEAAIKKSMEVNPELNFAQLNSVCDHIQLLVEALAYEQAREGNSAYLPEGDVLRLYPKLIQLAAARFYLLRSSENSMS